MDEFKPLLDYISRYVELTDEEAHHFMSFLKIKQVRKKQFIVQPDFICKHKSYVLKGAFRAYLVDNEGKEHTLADQTLKVIEKIALDQQVSTIYPTHFGPVTPAELTKYIREEPTLQKLSQLQTDLLGEVSQGKTTLLNKFLAEDYVLNNSEGVQFSKAAFVEHYISPPKTKIEGITAEDFRIVYADNNMAIMTFIENINWQGKSSKAFLLQLLM